MCLGPGRLAALERWLPYTVTILDRFHCIVTSCMSILCISCVDRSLRSTPSLITLLEAVS